MALASGIAAADPPAATPHLLRAALVERRTAAVGPFLRRPQLQSRSLAEAGTSRAFELADRRVADTDPGGRIVLDPKRIADNLVNGLLETASSSMSLWYRELRHHDLLLVPTLSTECIGLSLSGSF